MDWNKIAVLLELIGFFIASVTVALLKIQTIKRFADVIKSKIIDLNVYFTDSRPDLESAKGEFTTTIKIFYKDFIRLLRKLPIVWLRIVLYIVIYLVRLKFRKLYELLRESVPAFIFTFSWPLILVFIIPWTLIGFILMFLLHITPIVTDKLAANEFITTGAILFGTLMILIGLSIELAVVLNSP